MINSNANAHCDSFRPLLFAALEGQLDRDERVLVNAHLAYCESCRSLERSERALTDLLDPIDRVSPAAQAAPSWRVARFAATLGIAAALTVLLFVLRDDGFPCSRSTVRLFEASRPSSTIARGPRRTRSTQRGLEPDPFRATRAERRSRRSDTAEVSRRRSRPRTAPERSARARTCRP